LGRYEWEYGTPVETTEGIQIKILVGMGAGRPYLIIISRPCEQTCEAKESALVNALRYISSILVYEVNDEHFGMYVQQR
jgi:hypothetical protein